MASIRLSSGHDIPILGLGTWQSEPGEVGSAVRAAIEAGYRHVDCAYFYRNEKEIGEVLSEMFAKGTVKREDLFITSKVWNTFHSYSKAQENIATILGDLQLDYIDLLLIHWPQGYEEGGEIFPVDEHGNSRPSDVDYLDTWQALEEAKESEKVRSIGLSNFNHKQIERVWQAANIKPAVLQVEMSPLLSQEKLRAYCRSKNIAVTAYSPLGNPGSSLRKPHDPSVLGEPKICEIAKAHGKSAAQVVLRWFVELGVIVIPKSINKDRIKENIDIFDFELSADQIAQLNSLNINHRTVDFDQHHKYYAFGEKF